MFDLQSSDYDPRPYNHRNNSSNDHAPSRNLDAHSHASASVTHSSSRPELAQKRMNTFDSTHSSRSNKHSTDQGLLAPTRVNALGRKDSNVSESGSAPDSLLDLYGPQSGRGSASMEYGAREHGASKGSSNSENVVDEQDPENSRWIHRDKLARIESRELQAAGLVLPRSRTASRSRGPRDRSRDQLGGALSNSRSEQFQKRQRVGSSSSGDGAEQQQDANWDLRLPEEAAEDFHSPLRPSTSRIPLCKTSPMPIPLDYIDRNAPMLRPSGGHAIEDEAIQYPRPRRRSSSHLLPESASAFVASSQTGRRQPSDQSPTKKNPTLPGSRKTSVSNPRSASGTHNTRPKTRSGTTTTSRPTTRSGENGSAATKRPEGDPPWLATMYKPDPRLPPDQQMLPTVAKRLQQEQWEREGKPGTAYDTAFRPMNNEHISQPPSPQPPSPQPALAAHAPVSASGTPEKATVDGEEGARTWPLKEQAETASTKEGRPGTAGGAYSTMPRIHQGTPQGMGPMPEPRTEAQVRPIRLQNAPESKKGGGCGCVMM